MPRRKRNRNQQKQQEQVNVVRTKDEILDILDDSDIENFVVLGTNAKGEFQIYATILQLGFMHHMINSGLFQINVQEMHNLAVSREAERMPAQEANASE